MNQKPKDLQELIFKKFIKLPLKQKLVIYAKFVHDKSFKTYNDDFLNLNRRNISNIYRSFITSVREGV